MEIKEISDPSTIFKMIGTLYRQFPVYTILEGKPRQVKIIAIKEQGVLIQSPEDSQNPVERSLLLTNAGNLLLCKFKVISKDPRGIELLYPIKLDIKTASRTANRYQANKAPIHISNIISQSMIPHDLADDTMKVEAITKSYIQKLKGRFTLADIFIHERMDTRSRLMQDSGKHIFVPDTKSPDSVPENFIPFSEHIQLLKQGKGLSKYISEICVPLKYRGFNMFGYLQILHLEKTDINDYNLVLHAANKLSKELMEAEIFNESKHKSSIMDISRQGFSFSHPQSKYFGKLFSIGGTIIFDLFEDEKNIGSLRAVVRNIKPLEKLFRIGCQFFHIAEEHKIVEDILMKYFPDSLKEEEPLNEEKRERPKTKTDDILDKLVDTNETEEEIKHADIVPTLPEDSPEKENPE